MTPIEWNFLRYFYDGKDVVITNFMYLRLRKIIRKVVLKIIMSWLHYRINVACKIFISGIVIALMCNVIVNVIMYILRQLLFFLGLQNMECRPNVETEHAFTSCE